MSHKRLSAAIRAQVHFRPLHTLHVTVVQPLV
jgi:hypothetical protein